MNYKIVTLDEKKVSGLKTRTTNENGQSIKDIGTLWQKLMTQNLYQKINHKTDHTAIGLYTEYESDATKPYTFLCGCEVTNETDGFDCIIIPAGNYAKFTIKGDMVEAVGKAWNEIWEMDLDRKFSCDFEHYHNDNADMSNQTIDIYISLN